MKLGNLWVIKKEDHWSIRLIRGWGYRELIVLRRWPFSMTLKKYTVVAYGGDSYLVFPTQGRA